jgi:hypothetical protein
MLTLLVFPLQPENVSGSRFSLQINHFENVLTDDVCVTLQSAQSALKKLATKPRATLPTTSPRKKTSTKSSKPRFVPLSTYNKRDLGVISGADVCSVQHSKGDKEAEDEASKGAEKEIKDIQEAGKKSQAGIVKDLLSAVYDASPVAPSKADA